MPGMGPHALHLDGLVVDAHEGSAGDRGAVDEEQEEHPARRLMEAFGRVAGQLGR